MYFIQGEEMNFHWLFGHKYELKKLFYRATTENSYGVNCYKITTFGYYVCSCGKTKIESLGITDMSMDEKRFGDKVNYLHSLGYIDNMKFYGWLAYEASKEQTREKDNIQTKD